ncbi:hypothetical protein VKT23_016548 [Stygiomarasmius scandens]|uniref:Uncharacterized protein n=1 Tax=Marasmiellus scandens TaxID=2682957 RepID=A0ABR1IYT6_9AGAR
MTMMTTDMVHILESYYLKNNVLLFTLGNLSMKFCPRATSIHQAITLALNTSEPITVSHILPLYVHFAGFDDICPDAVVAFEHAMEKGRVIEASSTDATNDQEHEFAMGRVAVEMPVELAVVKLRNEYWAEKLGKTKDEKGSCRVCTCEECGRMRLVRPETVSGIEKSQYVVMKAKDLKVISSGTQDEPEMVRKSEEARGKGSAVRRRAKKTKKTKKVVQGASA